MKILFRIFNQIINFFKKPDYRLLFEHQENGDLLHRDSNGNWHLIRKIDEQEN
jgi:hypothetical protein